MDATPSDARPMLSIVICTDGRAQALSKTLRSLRYLEGPEFEVCVVRGPTEDGVGEVLEPWGGRIKVAHNPERNLSISRNLGIAMAGGAVVAFLDDDAIPEPEWLQDIADAFSDPCVGGAGGFVYDHTGKHFQYRFATADRLGDADLGWAHATPAFCFPFSANYPHLLGTNSAFRRDAMLQAGGFDEEFDYYLDETDLCCRLVDEGWGIRQLPNAFVHHKFLPSEIRNEHRVLRRWYSVIKNKIYFSLANGRHHHGMQTIVDAARVFVEGLRANVERAISQGLLCESDQDRFEIEVNRAWEDGLIRGLMPRTKLGAHLSRTAQGGAPIPFATIRPVGARFTVCMINEGYVGDRMGGTGCYVDEFARGLAALGHQVHMLVPEEGGDRVDVEEDVWVHRIMPCPSARPDPPEGFYVPLEIWNRSAALLAEVREIAEKRPVDWVYAPLLGCAGIALLHDRRFRLITSIFATVPPSPGHDSERAGGEPHFSVPREVMLALETQLLQESHIVHASSYAAADEAAASHGIALDEKRLVLGQVGEEDWSAFAARPQSRPRPISPLPFIPAVCERGQCGPAGRP